MESLKRIVIPLETPPAVKCFTQDLWLAECCIGPDGVAVFHIETLEEALQTNALQIMRGWSAGYVPFALCETTEAAHAACDAMRELQGLFREGQRRQAARQSDIPADAEQAQDADQREAAKELGERPRGQKREYDDGTNKASVKSC